MSRVLRLAIHPVPELSVRDTSLRYTDILFGFVIRELFLRLQGWPGLEHAVRWQLVAGTVLVLGSWIGYRRSLNLSAFEVKFFNLPLGRFVVDQLMLILYFRIATLTPTDGSAIPDRAALALHTARLIALVFVLYLIWDLLGIWMAAARRTDDNGRIRPRYPYVKGELITEEPARKDWIGLLVTASALVLLAAVWLSAPRAGARWVFPGIILVLLAYRWAKETKTSCRLQSA